MKHNLKKSLLSSMALILVCVMMLTATTYAWFTDSVTSGTNKIVAGNLDIDVLHTNAKITTAESVQGKTNLFTDKDGNAMLWEPGAISYENFTVKNLGTLSLKYKLAMNITDYNALNGHTLKEALKVKVLTGSDILSTVDRSAVQALNWATTDTLDVFNTAGELLVGEADTFQVIVYWQPTANDDLYNVKNGAKTSDGQPLFIDFGINVVASQYTDEADAFDKNYDQGIVLPDLPVSINKTFQSEKIINKDIASDTVIVKNKSTNVGVATMPKAAVKTVVEAIEENLTDKKANTDTETVIYLDVKTTEKTETTVTYSIDLSAVMTYTDDSNQTKTKKLDSLNGKMDDKIITAEMNIGKGLSNVAVKHYTTPMTELESASVDAEGFYYDKATGTLTIKSKTFSPFTVDYTIDAETAIGGVVYATLEEALAVAQDGDTIEILKDIACDHTITAEFGQINVTINGNKHTIKVTGTAASTDDETDYYGLVIGTTDYETPLRPTVVVNDLTVEAPYFPIYASDTCDVTLNDCVAKQTATTGTGYRRVAVGASFTSNLVINSGNYESTLHAIYAFNTGCDITVNGGTFVGALQKDAPVGSDPVAFTIKGGTFSVNPKTTGAVIADGYKVVANNNGTFTVKEKVAPVPVDGVFTANTNEQLEEVIAELNANENYTTGDYTIQLGAGDIGGVWDEANQGWIANVYVIKQFPQWNGNYGNSSTNNNIPTPPADHLRVTIVGSDTGRTNFKGAILVVGFGYSNGGSYNITADKVRTEIKNLDFDYTDVIGVDEAGTNFGKATDGYMPIIGCGASANVIITDCNFKRISRIKLGLAQGNDSTANLLNANGKVQSVKGYCFNPVISGCTFTDCDTCIDGYFSGAEWSAFTNITATNCDAFINAQQGCTNPIVVSGCTITCNNYLIRTANVGVKFTFKECTVNIKDSSLTNKYGLIVFRGLNHSIVIEDCTLTGSKEVHCMDGSGGKSDITNVLTMKGTSPNASDMIEYKTCDAGTDCTIKDYTEQ